MIDARSNGWSAADSDVPAALHDAAITGLRPIYDSSNEALLARLEHPALGEGLGVYKPGRGERPLRDFPYGTLHRREVAAYELSRLLGWDIVPPTVERDGPHGVGSMQLFIEHNPREHYFVLRERAELVDQLVRIAVFDLAANNADRKGGHVLCSEGGRLWAIDNGLCFHAHEKLRTVIWDFAGVDVPAHLRADVRRVRDCLEAEDAAAEPLAALLSAREQAALLDRCRQLLDRPVLPEMYPWRCTPWPLI